jgi:hypothetical protein
MAEPEADALTDRPTPEPPLEPSDIARRIQREGKDEPLPGKVKAAGEEADLEVSGEYEAKQEREAGRGDPKPVEPKTTVDES